jgi:hypothetical protein
MPRNAVLSLALAVTVTTSACAHASPAQRVGMVTAGVGLLVTASALATVEDDHEYDSDAGSGDICPDGICLITFGVLATVGALVLGGLMSGTDHGKEPPPARIAPVYKDGPPGGENAEVAVLPREHRPLPELATDERTLQLAKQVRSAALRGDCDAAAITLATIRERDPRYHGALVSSSVIVGCR